MSQNRSTTKVRVNLVNPGELLELPGIGPREATAIVQFRAEHGPITTPMELSRVLDSAPMSESLWERMDFAPSDTTAQEAPGA